MEMKLNQTRNQAPRCHCENQSVINTFLCLTRGAQVNRDRGAAIPVY